MDVHTREECDALLARAREGAYSVRAIKKSERRKMPAAPFTTSNLQQEASRKLNFNTGKTMQIAQQLYEGVELAGRGPAGPCDLYRTDSTRISDEALASVREMIQSTYGEPFLPAEPNIYKSRKTAQDAHEAIRPHGHHAPPRGHQGLPDPRPVPPLPPHLRPLCLQPDDPGGV